MDMVRDISDWVIVMAQGKVIAEGSPHDIMANDAVIDAYLGGHHDAPLTEAEERAQIEAGEAELRREAEHGSALEREGRS